jgi:hypothetical protein
MSTRKPNQENSKTVLTNAKSNVGKRFRRMTHGCAGSDLSAVRRQSDSTAQEGSH